MTSDSERKEERVEEEINSVVYGVRGLPGIGKAFWATRKAAEPRNESPIEPGRRTGLLWVRGSVRTYLDLIVSPAGHRLLAAGEAVDIKKEERKAAAEGVEVYRYMTARDGVLS